MKKPCVFFDRDGIVNKSPGPGYVERWEDFHLQLGFISALKIAIAKGYPSIIITNQQGVAKGLYSKEKLAQIHGNMRAQFRAHAVDVIDVFSCTHYATDHCDCRKPKPGLFFEASKKYELDLSRSWMIGDSEKDVEAGQAAGCRTIRVCPLLEKTAAEFQVEKIDEVAAILEQELVSCVS